MMRYGLFVAVCIFMMGGCDGKKNIQNAWAATAVGLTAPLALPNLIPTDIFELITKVK